MPGTTRPAASDGPAAHSESARARALISALKLTYLPRESGYIAILGRSSWLVETRCPSDGTRELAAQSHNYYMLTAQYPINYLHRLESDDTHVLLEGGPVDYFIFHPPRPGENVKAERIQVGLRLDEGQHPVVAVPAGCWKALKLCDGVSHALTVNVLSPEFTQDRVRIGERRRWVEQFAGSAAWATPDFLTALIGPNLIEEEP
jgi:uncharacterized protein